MTICQVFAGNASVSKKHNIENSKSWNEFCNLFFQKFNLVNLFGLQDLMVLSGYNH